MENDFLLSVLQDAKIGCWEADMKRRQFRFHGIMRDLTACPDGRISFDDFRERISPPYRQYAFAEVEFSMGRIPNERIFPIRIGSAEVWLQWKLLGDYTDPDGSKHYTGYARQVEQSEAEIKRVDDLLYRLNSISQTLLSLLQTDQVDETVHKILADILSIFHGSRAYIVRFDWEQRMHDCMFEVTADGVEPERELVSQFRMDEMQWWTDRVSQGQPIMLNTLDELPAEAQIERRALEMQHIRSLLVMPLATRDKVWGYAGIDVVESVRNWTNVDCEWFSSLVNIISLCLELQHSEKEAKEERSYLEALYRHMPPGYVRIEVLRDEQGEAYDYRVLDSNFAADAIVGERRENYVGRTAHEMGLTPVFLTDLLRVLDTGEYLELDTVLSQNKKQIHAQLYSIRRDEVICLMTDTTEVQKAHEALSRNEKLLRNIFENIQVGMELYDKDGFLVDLNNKDMEIFGVADKKDALGINFFDNPNVPEQVRQGLLAGRDQVFRVNYPFDRVKGYYRSGKTGYLEIFSTANMLYDLEGNRVNYLLTNIDNTEITRAHSRIAEFESSFSLVSRFGKVGYCRFDLLTKEGYGVPQWYHNLGESEDTPLTGVIGVYSHVDPDDRAAIMECIRRVKAGQIDNFGLDLRIDPGPNEHWTRINVMRNPLNNDPSKIEMVCVNYDITELKQTERNLIEAKNKAEVSDRLKSAFLANMSHEIRTPLNAIVGFSYLLTETDDPDDRREYMRVVEENNNLLLKLISDILDLAKIEAGTFEFNYEMIDVNQLCEEAVRSLALKVQNKPVKLLFGAHEKECTVFGDKSRLLQIITNFVTNAVKFTPEGSITIGYALELPDIRFWVEDTGKGIPRDQIDRIFDRFVKLNSFAQGTGLGLPICKSIVEQMKGRIGVESEVGRGSRFWFTVPVDRPDLRTE
ncbi:ATP-binding protein [Alistipes sp.]|uniref:sensor histidine kinase n=1 Tax=Alistipes sp. TaxID=1872444 RepID=UPI003AF02D3F